MSDRWVVVLALCAAAGAAHPAPVPLALGLSLVGTALLVRSSVLLCASTAVLVSTLAARSLAGLAGVDEPTPVAGEATLVTDPERSLTGIRVEARFGSRRVELRAAGVAAEALAQRLAGEVVTVRGDLTPAPADPWLVSRHISGRLRVLLVEGWRPGEAASRLANAARRTLVQGAAPLSRSERALYTGLVVGDDREQSAATADSFQGAGLTHLLAVSGQNVAFVISLARPALARLRIWPRWLATLALVALFGVMTRFEPSVLRASAMSALAVSTATVGTPVSRLRILGLAVTGLLVVDPLLVRSVGFLLSTAATVAIMSWAEPIGEALPGPGWLRRPLGVTIAAQIGVAPVLLLTFGPMPLATLPANLLAVPAAGAVMVWGITAGMVAGLVGEPLAAVLHLPTRLLLAWLAAVAERSASLPLGHLDARHSVALALGFALAAAAPRLGVTWARAVGLGVAGAALALAAIVAHAPPGLRSNPTPGVVLWRSAGTDVVVLGGVGGRTSLWPKQVLTDLREAGVGAIDVLVLADVSAGRELAEALDQRHPIGVVVLGPGADAPHIEADIVPAPSSPVDASVGSLRLRITPTADRLVVEATRGGAGPPQGGHGTARARRPPQ